MWRSTCKYLWDGQEFWNVRRNPMVLSVNDGSTYVLGRDPETITIKDVLIVSETRARKPGVGESESGGGRD
jgi:hypothetical protein